MFEQFFKSEAASGILLLGTTVLALAVANASVTAPFYFQALASYAGGLSVLHWINDGLMAVFFLLVGLEIKQEVTGGELATWSQRALPGMAALGGMVAPALVYVAFNHGVAGGMHGWAIPTATDIAFSLGVLAMMGARAPAPLKIFLTALAIIDDLFAVLIIALFYGAGLSWPWLAAAAAVLAALIAMNRLGVMPLSPYLLLGGLLWFCVLKSGIHATVAGVLLALVMPARGEASPGLRLEHALSGPVAFFIVPVFAFANAGVPLQGLSLVTLAEPITLGVAAGLFLGKQLGVFGATWLGVRAGLGSLPRGVSWLALYGVSLLCGIGFTISLFIGALAFSHVEAQDAAKLGVIAGSLISGLGGWLVLSLAAPPRRDKEDTMTVDDRMISFANRLADASGAVIRPFFRQRIAVDSKERPGHSFDPVTEADKGAERAIRAIIARDRPDDAILGEEYGEKPGTSGFRWVLDPVDGTRCFITGRHEWGSLIALEKDEVPVLGILDQPVLGERFVGVNGRSVLLQGETRTALKVRPCESLKDAILCATDPSAYMSEEQQAAFARVKAQARMTRYHGDCYLFAMLAMGFVDIVIEAGFKRWDAAALIPLVEGAGGTMTAWDGGDCRDGKTILACGDKRIHEEAIKLLK